jgi:hypothetical protein
MGAQEFKFLGNCPVCAEPFRHERAHLVEKNAEAVMLHLDCGHCNGSLLLAVYSGVQGLVTTVGLPTDLKKSDLPKLSKNSHTITADDVLALHAFLEHKK